jgi:hypothetical protein
MVISCEGLVVENVFNIYTTFLLMVCTGTRSLWKELVQQRRVKFGPQESHTCLRLALQSVEILGGGDAMRVTVKIQTWWRA